MTENLRMTVNEKTRILGLRATQISNGSEPKVPVGNETDPLRIARLELRARKINMIIKRPYPDGTEREIPVSDFIIP
jgi:DNA-directed RNA polymerase subunit K/omega